MTISAGRLNVKKVIRAFIENALIWGHDPKMFSIYLAIDTNFQNTRVEDFRLDEDFEKIVNKVVYISEKDRENLAEEIISKSNVSREIVETLFVGAGYSKQRNSVLLWALRDRNDYAIYVDDDESPFVPIKDADDNLRWENLDFFGPHIKELSSGTDITRGPYLGYQSPVPSDFEKDVPEDIRVKLGESLHWGSDVITKYSFFNLMNQIKYLPEEELKNPSRPFVVEEGHLGKQIYAGNMGINLRSVRMGKIPIFYTPPHARGEDTIFALQLGKIVVKEVASYIFHDPFGIYSSIFDGEFPEILKNIPLTSNSKQRFAKALMGWLMYAPILISMTSKNEVEKIERIGKMLETIGEPANQLADLFDIPELRDCKNILRKYYEDVDSHSKNLEEIQKEWKNKILVSSI